MVNAQRLCILADLRREAGLSQQEMARLCGLHGRRSYQTAGAWERGDYAPDPQRRTNFIHYLWDSLGLRRVPQRFEEVWAILVEAWGWAPVSDDEWRTFTHQPRPVWKLTPPSAQRLPFQAPQLTGPFVGRSQVMGQIRERLSSSTRGQLLALTGMGGIGKTSVAVRTAHDLRRHFSDGMLWGNPSVSEPSAILDSWGQAYGYDFSRLHDVESKAAAFRDLVADKRMLIVLDNVVTAESVLPLLPGSLSSALLITTRNQEVGHALHAEVIPLPALDADASLALLTEIVRPERVLAEPEAAATICTLLEHLPLAVEITGQRLRARPERRLADFADRLRSVQVILSELQISDRAVRTSFEASWQALIPDLRQNFARLALFRARPFGVDAFAAISALSRYDAEEEIFTFVSLSLLIDSGDRHYRLHPLLADFAGEKLVDDPDADTIWLRFARHFCEVAQTQGMDLPLAAPEWDHLVEGMAVTHRLQVWDLATSYADALTQPWRRQGRFTQARQGFAWATDAARRLDDPRLIAQFLHEWGFACLEQDDYAAATPLLDEAIEIFAALGEVNDLADTQLLQARMAVEQDDYTKAEMILRNCWAVFAGMDEGRGLARTLYWQGLVYYYQGRYKDARGVHAQARSLQEALGEERDLVATLRSLADLAIVEKDYAAAEALCNWALTIAQSLDDHGERAAVFYLLAVVADCQQRWEEALIHAAEALAQFERIGDRGFQALTLYQQSQIYMKLNDYIRAEEILLRSRRLSEELEQGYTLTFVLHNLGRIYAATDRHTQARTILGEALQRAEQSDHPLSQRLRQQLADLD
jgi:tetratricopeptide (TPR) repeat protein/transcriptional regulator with XRE-family HTH domain